MRKELNIKILGTLLLVVLFTGCGPQPEPPLYHWGTYTKSASEFFHAQGNPEALQKHIDVLDEIINTSNASNQRVAPGLYAEIGQLYYQMGQREKGVSYLEKEVATYPESRMFIGRILNHMESSK